MFTLEEIAKAGQRYRDRYRNEPHIVLAKYDSRLGLIILELSTGGWFSFRPDDAQGLQGATALQLKEIEILPGEFAINFPLLDAQFDITALMQGRFGSRAWMAARLGAAGGASRSKAKTNAARANGKLGGRPRKTAASQL